LELIKKEKLFNEKLKSYQEQQQKYLIYLREKKQRVEKEKKLLDLVKSFESLHKILNKFA
jgi:hypothetical protein